MAIEQKYQPALDYIYSFVDYSLTRNLNNSSANFDLGRMVEFAESLGNPQTKFPCIHVAGTKGKGSTCALINSALMAAGYKVGLYSSPHLIDFTERIQVNGRKISHTEFVRLIDKLKPFIAQVKELTTFEIATGLAFEYFFEQKVDIAVIEVGLGGRLDATNIISPIISVITSISMDHMAILGDTLGKIAAEKAGIIKKNVPVVTSRQAPEAMDVIKTRAMDLEARFYRTEDGVFIKDGEHNLSRQKMQFLINENYLSVKNKNSKLKPSFTGSLNLSLPLLGPHQAENAATAYIALQVVRQAGFDISDKAIQKGFSHVKWPGRFQILSRKPLLIIDSAHNKDSAKRLKETILEYLPKKKLTLIFGASEDKDIKGMFGELLPLADEAIMTQSIHPRAMDSGRLVDLAAGYPAKIKKIVPIEKAIETALKKSRPDDIIIGTGSIFIAAAILEYEKTQKRK